MDHWTNLQNKYASVKDFGGIMSLHVKGALSHYSVFLCRFFAVENGGKETRGRDADQRVAGLGTIFF